MNVMDKARELSQAVLNAAAIASEMGELSNVQLLAQANASLQIQVCDLYDALSALGDRLDTLEGQLTNYRMGEL